MEVTYGSIFSEPALFSGKFCGYFATCLANVYCVPNSHEYICLELLIYSHIYLLKETSQHYLWL